MTDIRQVSDAMGSAGHGRAPARPRLTATVLLACGVFLAGAAAIAVGSSWQLWYLPFLAGVTTGVLTRLRGWGVGRTALAVTAMAASGWGAPLLWRASQGQPVAATARTVCALAGLPPVAALVIIVTLLVAISQGVTGLWLGRSATAALRRSTPHKKLVREGR